MKSDNNLVPSKILLFILRQVKEGNNTQYLLQKKKQGSYTYQLKRTVDDGFLERGERGKHNKIEYKLTERGKVYLKLFDEDGDD